MFKKKQSKNINPQHSEYIHKDTLVKVISSVKDGNWSSAKLAYDDCECKDLVDMWNEMIDLYGKKENYPDVNRIMET